MPHQNTLFFMKKRKERDILLIDKGSADSTVTCKTSPFIGIVQSFLAAAGVYGVLFSLIETLSLELDKRAVISVIIASALLFTEVFRRAKLRNYLIPIFIILYLGAGYRYWSWIWNGLLNVENLYIREFNRYYRTGLYEYLVGSFPVKTAVTAFMIFAGIALTFLACSTVFIQISRTVFVFLTVLLLILPFTLGLLPAPLPFAAYLIYLMDIKGMSTSILEKNKSRARLLPKEARRLVKLEQNISRRIGLKVGGILSIVLLFLLCILSLVFSPKSYSERVNLIGVKTAVVNGAEKLYQALSREGILDFQTKGAYLFQKYISQGGLGAGKLGRVGEVVFQYNTALKVTMPVIDSEVYLKGYVGSRYNADAWEGLSEEEQEEFQNIAKLWKGTDFQINNQSSYYLSLIGELDGNAYHNLNITGSGMEIERVNASPGFIFAPYGSDYPDENSRNLNSTEYVLPKIEQEKYKLEYYSVKDMIRLDEKAEYEKLLKYYGKKEEYGLLSADMKTVLNKLAEYHQYEAAYREFVYRIYTQVPEQGLERIKAEFGKYSYSEYREQYGAEALPMLVDMVKDYLKADTVYSLQPGTLPKDKDFVEYFLYENKTGYCTHYASAAAIIFRTMGIPSRYAEGYVVNAQDISRGKVVGDGGTDGSTGTSGITGITRGMGSARKKYDVMVKTMDILDTNAHAWVEVYIDGYGWIPVEVTPGSSNTSSTVTNAEKQDENKNTSSPDSSKETEGKEVSAKTKDTDPSYNSQTMADNFSITDAVSQAAGRWGSLPVAAAGVIAGVLLTLLIIGIRAAIIITARKKALRTKNLSKQVILRYMEIHRILAYYQIALTDNPDGKTGAICNKKRRKGAADPSFLLELLKKEEFKRFHQIALKAKFDKDWVTGQEAEEALNFYQDILASVYGKTTFLNRIIQRFILVF